MDLEQFPFKQLSWHSREMIGEGGFATIYKVSNQQKNQFVAIKQIDMKKFDCDYKMESLKNQIRIMMECRGKNTVTMHDFYVGKHYTYLILQLCERDLKELLMDRNCFTEREAIKIIADIVQGYKLLHDKKFIHRDIKPQNVLLKQSNFKITDFGFAKKIKYDGQKLRQICGTALYMAPQLFYGKDYSSKCDIWSLGLILYQLIFGYSPWLNKYIETYKVDIVIRQVAFPYKIQIGINTKDFIQKCLQLEQQDRLSFEQILNHPLIKDHSEGAPIVHYQIQPRVVKILGRVQQSFITKQINARQLFKKYEGYKGMDRNKFYSFLVELDPQITSYQSQQIFQIADFSKDYLVDLQEFKKFFLEVDYRHFQDIASKRIQQLGQMAKARNIPMSSLFEMLDLDKNAQIDERQFSCFIKYIAPKLNERQIRQMFVKFDKNSSKTIDTKEFFFQLTKNTYKNQGKVDFKNIERARRNVYCLRSYFVYKSINPVAFFKCQGQQGQSKKIVSLDQFGTMIRKINYVISRDQIIEMFRLIDQNSSDTIEIHQLQKLMEMPPMQAV